MATFISHYSGRDAANQADEWKWIYKVLDPWTWRVTNGSSHLHSALKRWFYGNSKVVAKYLKSTAGCKTEHTGLTCHRIELATQYGEMLAFFKTNAIHHVDLCWLIWIIVRKDKMHYQWKCYLFLYSHILNKSVRRRCINITLVIVCMHRHAHLVLLAINFSQLHPLD